MLATVAKCGYALGDVSEALRNDREVVLTAVAKHGAALRCASKALCRDREVMLTAVANDGWALQYAPEALCNDREVVLTAVASERHALQYVDKPLRFAAAVAVQWRRLRLLFLGQRDPGSPSRGCPSSSTLPLPARAAGGLLQSVAAWEVGDLEVTASLL